MSSEVETSLTIGFGQEIRDSSTTLGMTGRGPFNKPSYLQGEAVESKESGGSYLKAFITDSSAAPGMATVVRAE
jgi:hypothetical protein